jgi:DNA-binding response OmpR family regulator
VKAGAQRGTFNVRLAQRIQGRRGIYPELMARILIVEDDINFSGIVRAALILEGHAVVEANDGSTAEELISTYNFDLVISDIFMPEMTGLQLIGKLRDANNRTPVIAMTGGHFESEFYLKEAQRLGARHVLSKPFTVYDLLDVTHEVLSEGRCSD